MKEIIKVTLLIILTIAIAGGIIVGIDKTAKIINESTTKTALALPHDQYIHSCIKRQMSISYPYRPTFEPIIQLCQALYETKHPKEIS